MIDYRKIEELIVSGLQSYLSVDDDNPCYVIMANQTAPVPKYPYVTYTITTTTETKGGTYGFFDDGKYYRQLNQIWSFTVQSNDQTECNNLALDAYDYFAHHGCTYLSDNNISVVDISNMTNRDNFITAEYEYRQGFDVRFGLMYSITPKEDEVGGYIEKVTLKSEIEDIQHEIDV